MEINVKNNLLINNVLLKGATSVEVTEDNIVRFGRSPFYNMGECKCKDINKLLIDDKEIIKNGKLLVDCWDCHDCPICKKVDFGIYLTPHTFKREKGYYCGKNKVYSENIDNLKNSRVKSKGEIELKNSYKIIEDKFKYRREKYITSKSIKECVDDIEDCMNPSNERDAINEYGHKRIELEQIRLYKNDIGYTVNHYGIIGDYGWSSKIYIHKRCDVNKLASVLRSIAFRYKGDFKNEL